MIRYCAACGAQNFVSPERSRAPVPPICWKCGAELPAAPETAARTAESNGDERSENPSGDERNA